MYTKINTKEIFFFKLNLKFSRENTNNIMILACGKATCIIALAGSIGLALGCVWLSEKTIKTDSEQT